MEFYSQAFDSPENLAINIYHETSHWVDVAGRSGGFKRSDTPDVSFRTEQHAYERSSRFAAKLGLSTTDYDEKAKKFKLQADTVIAKGLSWEQVVRDYPNWIGTDRKGSLALAPAETELAPGDEALLEKKFAEAGKKAAAREQEQTQIVQRDHDARLRETIISLTRRSCDNPGSVSQAELTALPRPFQKDKDFFWIGPMQPSEFPGREHCLNIFEYLAFSGRDAEELRKVSGPKQGPAPINGVIPSYPSAPAAKKTPFSRVLPEYKSYAMNACSAPQQISMNMILIEAYDHSFHEYDDALIERLKSGLNDCARRVFDYLIAAQRRSDTLAMDSDRIREKVREFTPAPPVGGGGGYSPPRSSEPGCEYDPNIGGTICPKAR